MAGRMCDVKKGDLVDLPNKRVGKAKSQKTPGVRERGRWETRTARHEESEGS
jgi:hypothetical protein